VAKLFIHFTGRRAFVVIAIAIIGAALLGDGFGFFEWT
jgi:hypothetical protein